MSTAIKSRHGSIPQKTALKMNKPTDPIFTTRQHYVLELPLRTAVRILHPEQVIVKVGSKFIDVGSLCYALRSEEQRAAKKPSQVEESTLLPKRRAVVKQLIKVASEMMVSKRPSTMYGELLAFGMFVDWSDRNDHVECLTCKDVMERAYLGYVAHVNEIFQQGNIEAPTAFARQSHVMKLLAAVTGNPEFGQGVCLIRDRNQGARKGTEPANSDDFAHTLAMAEMMFDGLADLLLNNKPFPYELKLPESLNWETGNHLWIFPTNVWNLPPHLWGEERVRLGKPNWPYDYKRGRLATIDEIWHWYKVKTERAKRVLADKLITDAKRLIDEANANYRHRIRIQLATSAHHAFLLLFMANTGGNLAVIREIESGDVIDAEVVNQNYRAIKYRASGKVVTLIVPVSFMPSLRKFMELRNYMLDNQHHPYLFLAVGVKQKNLDAPTQITDKGLETIYALMKSIDVKITVIRPRQIRATVDDWYLRHYETAIAAKVMGHDEETENKKYGRGSSVDHRDDMTAFLRKISDTAKKQKVVVSRDELGGAAPLEQGGGCESYGHPDGMSDDPMFQPSCDGGCWYCLHRCLVADEEDARKIASAAFLMEQLILGPAHEKALRPLIQKCEEDLTAIASVGDCESMVKRVKVEVFEDGELTHFWAEKYHLFLELGVIT
jgi:hypothetical protein